MITKQIIIERATAKANNGDDRDLVAINSMTDIEISQYLNKVNFNVNKPDPLVRFSTAIANLKDVRLARQWNEIIEQSEDKPTPLGRMLARTKWILYITQANNHKLMIEFLEAMNGRKDND